MNRIKNILSLFDGISCGRVALEKSNIKINKYYASEINKDAIEVSKSNWNDIVQLGDINNWKQWDIDWKSIDLLIGGSPCQGFSFAGKQLNFEDERSKLFFTFVDILNHIKKLNPNVKFLLENVKMKKEYQNIISEYLGVEPININSSLVSAQLRNRFYWCNWKVEQPQDKGILLKDILEKGYTDREKSRCILESESRPLKTKDKIINRYFTVGFSTIIFKDKDLSDYAKQKIKERLKDERPIAFNWFNTKMLNDKSATLIANDGWSGKGTTMIIEDDDIRYLNQLELERLQTLPEGYTKSVNRNKAAGLIGNGWTVDVISHIFNELIG